jgi:hypothetical protein
MPVVKIEEELAHVAAVAGMASGYVIARDVARDLGGQVGD